jgi:hypothetical protein
MPAQNRDLKLDNGGMQRPTRRPVSLRELQDRISKQDIKACTIAAPICWREQNRG